MNIAIEEDIRFILMIVLMVGVGKVRTITSTF